MSEPLVSIIMPVYNSGKYLVEAIESVRNQTHTNWELLVINDGSTDNSVKLLHEFKADQRIRIFSQENKGVSAARNVGILNMKGDYFCFLDADDILPSRSIKARLDLFKNETGLMFVDGAVVFMEGSERKQVRHYIPSYKGHPLKELFTLRDSCFAGLTWMIKNTGTGILMNEGIKHGEDLLFFMEWSRQSAGVYSYTTECVLEYRQHEASAMRNLEALELGYWSIYDSIKDWKEFRWTLRLVYRLKVKRFMFLAYLKRGDYLKAFQVLIK